MYHTLEILAQDMMNQVVSLLLNCCLTGRWSSGFRIFVDSVFCPFWLQGNRNPEVLACAALFITIIK